MEIDTIKSTRNPATYLVLPAKANTTEVRLTTPILIVGSGSGANSEECKDGKQEKLRARPVQEP